MRTFTDVCGNGDGSADLEVVLTESPAQLRRTKDEATGLALIDLD